MLPTRIIESHGHRTSLTEMGPRDGPVVAFIHGWPELAHSWRHQVTTFSSLGFRVLAPDMRGYGGSSIYTRHDAYAQRFVVADMINLIDILEIESALWVGHDWGSATVWNIASHHPDRCVGVANISIPYRTVERGLSALVPLVNRDIYPEDVYPLGRWSKLKLYEDSFDAVTATFEADVEATIRALMRAGDPASITRPSPRATIGGDGGYFGGAARAPEVPRDSDVLSKQDLRVYTEALTRGGFFGPNSYYRNAADNLAYSDESVNGGRLALPVLFMAAEFDGTCEAIVSRLAEPMAEYCEDLTMARISSGHWAAQEKPREVNAALAGWLAAKVPDHWPYPDGRLPAQQLTAPPSA